MMQMEPQGVCRLPRTRGTRSCNLPSLAIYFRVLYQPVIFYLHIDRELMPAEQSDPDLMMSVSRSAETSLPPLVRILGEFEVDCAI